MGVTIIYRDRASEASGASADGDNLWLPLDDMKRCAGWELKAEGLCLDELCVPIPPDRKAEFLDASGRANLVAIARHLGQPALHDEDSDVWLFGEAAATRRDALRSLKAPDFTLPDLDGSLHSLSDYRGRKVLLLSWASW